MTPEELRAALVPGSVWTLDNFRPPIRVTIMSVDGDNVTYGVPQYPADTATLKVDEFLSGFWVLGER